MKKCNNHSPSSFDQGDQMNGLPESRTSSSEETVLDEVVSRLKRCLLYAQHLDHSPPMPLLNVPGPSGVLREEEEEEEERMSLSLKDRAEETRVEERMSSSMKDRVEETTRRKEEMDRRPDREEERMSPSMKDQVEETREEERMSPSMKDQVEETTRRKEEMDRRPDGELSSSCVGESKEEEMEIVQYKDETQMTDIMRLITKDLSEPYSVYTYRYFIHNWPELCLLAFQKVTGQLVGSVVCKLDTNRQNRRRGYIAMLAVDKICRRLGIGTRLVQQAIDNMQKNGCDEVVLETEVTNLDALRLYENLGFIREKRLFRYYLNGVDAFRLKLFFTPPPPLSDSYYSGIM